MLFRKMAAELFDGTNCKRVGEWVEECVAVFVVVAVELLVIGGGPFG